MAIVRIEKRVSDKSGSETDVVGITFAVNGTTYEMDLTRDEQAEFVRDIAPWTHIARKTAARGRSRTSTSRPESDVDRAAVRAWAAGNGFTVAPRGRIPAKVIEAYNLATSTPSKNDTPARVASVPFSDAKTS